MSSINPKKLKVVELKRELENRNIPTTKSMKKADLVALLLSAIESESGQVKEFSSSEAPDDSAQSEIEETDAQQQEPGTTSKTADASIEVAAEIQDAVEKPQEQEAVDNCPTQIAATDESSVQDADLAKSEDPTPTEGTEAEDKKMETESENVESGPVETQKSEDDHVKEESLPCNDVVAEVEKAEETSKEADDSKDSNMNEAKKDIVKEETEKPESKMEEAPAPKENLENGKPDANVDSKEPVRKRRHDDRSDRSSRWEDRYAPPEEEPEEYFDDNLVVLDLYNCDLNFKVSRDRYGGQPLTMEGFAYLWGGSRATYGVKSGKICFECKIQEEDAVKHLASDEPHPRVVRVGWSTDKCGLQLGEEALSYGYGGTGKFSVDRQFTDYGETFREGDVIGCYIDLQQEEKFELFFTKNGKFLGSAFVEEKSNLGDEALFPHVLCKNTCVELNLGQKSAPHFPHPEELQGYEFISSLTLEQRTRAMKAPFSKKECEVLMMCGLPGSGKTYYASQKIKDEPSKKYNILGTNEIMNKMRVMGVARKRNYAGRWELLIQNANNCLNRLLQIACRKRRNYIVDQTNVYASAQRRKMRPFEGFQRKAIVIVPTDEEYKKRFDKRTKDEGKEVPDIAVLEMKANFSLPEAGNLFDEVIFTELDQQEAEKLVEQYREEGIKNGPPPEKRPRGGDFRNRGGDGDWRSGRGFRGPPQMPYGSGGGWNRFGPPMGFGRGGYGPGGFRGGRGRGNFRSGGGFGNRQGGGGRDFNRNDRRDNFGGRRDNQRGGPNRNKGGWQNRQNFGDGGRGGMMGGYNKNNQGRSFDMNKSGNYRGNSGGSMQYHGRQQQQYKFQQGNRQNTQSNAPQSAQAYTYGHHPQQQQQQQQQQQNYASNSNYGSSGYGYQQPNTQTTGNTQMQSVPSQQQGYQQAYGQQDYSQQWAQYYQAQQTQQYQNYYANYQQYYNQQATQQTQPKS